MVSDWKGSISATTRPIATISSSMQRSIHSAFNREKRGEKALQTYDILPWPKNHYRREIHEVDPTVRSWYRVISSFGSTSSRPGGICASRVALQIEVDVAWHRMIALRINLMNISAVTIFLARVVCGKTWRKASCRLTKTKRDRSRSVQQLRSSFFLESTGFFFLVTSSTESKAIWVSITTEIGCSLCDAGPLPLIDRKSERFSLSWWTSKEHYSSSSRRTLTNEASPYRLEKDLSIGTFFFKICAKMTPQRRSKAIDNYPSKFDWPGIKGLKKIDPTEVHLSSKCLLSNLQLIHHGTIHRNTDL